MADYYFGCYWNDRTEDLDACSSHVLKSLRALAECDPAFENVYLVPDTGQLPYEIEVEPASVKSTVEAGRSREDFPPYGVIERLGYRSSFVSKDFRKRGSEWSLNFRCGASMPGVPNSAVLKASKTGEARERLLQYDTAYSIIQSLIDIWNPDFANVKTSGTITRQPNGQLTAKKDPIGWINYYAARLGTVPGDMPVYRRVDIDKKGTLLILAPDSEMMDDPEYIDASRTVSAALKEAGMIPHETEKS